MSTTKVLAVILAFCTLNSSFSTNFILKSLIVDQKLSKSICKITNDVTSSKTDTQDILIGNVGGNIWSSTINDIVSCIDDETTVVVSDLNAIMTENNLRKASVTILALKWLNVVSSTLIEEKTFKKKFKKQFLNWSINFILKNIFKLFETLN